MILEMSSILFQNKILIFKLIIERSLYEKFGSAMKINEKSKKEKVK